MNQLRNLLLCLLNLAIGGVWANTQPNPPVCFTNRFGVEQCGYGENAPSPTVPNNRPRFVSPQAGTSGSSGVESLDGVRQSIIDYCSKQKDAGMSQLDGLCAPSNLPR